MTSPSAWIAGETTKSVVINMVLSLVFFLLVFGRAGPVPVWGVGAYAFDFTPQSFMITLMSTLVPGVLTRRAIAAGRVARLDARPRFPGPLPVRAVILALLAAGVGTAIAAALLALLHVDALGWWPALVAKIGYGALLAVVVTPIGLRDTLAAT